MDLTTITIPKIIPAVKAINQLRKYNPDQLINIINEQLESFIKSLTIITHTKKIFEFIDYCTGYTLNEVKAIIKILINAYKANGYTIKYSVYYKVYNNWHKTLKFKIKSISFKPSKISKTKYTLSGLNDSLSEQNDPPPYSESLIRNNNDITSCFI